MAIERITTVDETRDQASAFASVHARPERRKASHPHRRRFDIVPASIVTPIDLAAAADLSATPADLDPHSTNRELAPVKALARRESIYRRLLAVADAVGASAAAVTWAILDGAGWHWLVLLTPFIAIAIAKIQGQYDHDDMVINKGTVGEWRATGRTAVLTGLGVYFLWYASTATSQGRGLHPLFIFMLATFVFTVPARGIARTVARRVTSDERVLVVGAANHCEHLAQQLTDLPHIQLIGIVDDTDIDNGIASLREMVEELDVHRIVIGPYPAHAEDWIVRLVASAKWLGVRVSLMPSIMAVVGANTVVDEIDTTILLGVPRFGLSRSSEMVKRSFDLIIGSVALAFATPLILITVLAVKLDSPGPAFFRQQRIGRDGEPFTMLKFRSMVVDAEAMRSRLDEHNETNGLFKMADDPRVTRVGRLIRRTYVDELPQLINVLKGDMSLVGPRPLIESEDMLLEGIDRHRSCLPPGMTGPWQLRGPIDASLSELAKLDYHYASSWSVWSDLDILIGTVARVITRGGH